MFASHEDVGDWLQLIRAEYLEMPGMQLTKLQVERLWGLDPRTSEVLLGTLMDTKFLRRTPAGEYARADRDVA